MSRPAHLVLASRHLAARFFTSISPRPPAVADEVWAEDHLLPGELSLWRQMTNQDRRHSIKVAHRFVAARPAATRPEVAGALLHDVGKITCGLGTFARVAASVVGGRTERFRRYHDHERIGAELAAAVGSHPRTVELIAEDGPAYPTLRDCDRA